MLLQLTKIYKELLKIFLGYANSIVLDHDLEFNEFIFKLFILTFVCWLIFNYENMNNNEAILVGEL